MGDCELASLGHVFTHLSVQWLEKETTFNKIRETWRCLLKALMKNLHLLLPQCFVFDETLTICTLKLVTPYKCVYFRPCKSQSSMLWFIAFKYSSTCTCIHSGYVLANRLSEDPGTFLLIVEIVGSEDDNPMMSFPF